MGDPSSIDNAPAEMPGILAAWSRAPLYLRIVAALLLGAVVGYLLYLQGWTAAAEGLRLPSKYLLQLLSALAPPLILIAIVRALMTAEVRGRLARRMIGLLIVNTLAAIGFGLLVANTVQPGRYLKLKPPAAAKAHETHSLFTDFLDNVPKSLLGPLTDDGKVLGVIFLAVPFGMALRRCRHRPVGTVEELVDVAFDTLLVILHWVIQLVPLGVFGVVAGIVGTQGLRPFMALGMFIIAVLVGLLLQGSYYLLRVRMGSWVRPLDLIKGTRDALVMAFSTASSTATMPVTFECLRDRVGLREESASMGALVGSNFNNDGTALYEAMSALFIAQMVGVSLTLPQQLMVVLTSVIASVGAAGIPEAGLVTMTLVFTAVHLPVAYIPLLLTVDWFLDRCRTAVNVMGDMNVSCLLDGKVPRDRDPSAF